MQITIAIKGALSSVRAHSFRYKVKTRTTRSKSRTIQCRTRDEKSVHCKSFFSKLNKPSVAMYSLESTCRVVLTMSMFLLWRFLPDIRSSNAQNRFPALRYANNDRHKRCLIVKVPMHKTGFQRCAMQITIAIKGALSSVRAHSFRCAMQITIAIKGALSSVRAHSFRYKVKTRTTRSKSRTIQCRTRDEKRRAELF
ncbi:hypothetical protein T02_12407 [Trichinella nativa]|uniref:Uncharacterized protein n=1 Tax=Trichinella nativa TaxID=6335 RepID=A0A0V1KK79_9BILA|nr:hypothetical protein T02_12407 [Trichinella nativa]